MVSTIPPLLHIHTLSVTCVVTTLWPADLCSPLDSCTYLHTQEKYQNSSTLIIHFYFARTWKKSFSRCTVSAFSTHRSKSKVLVDSVISYCPVTAIISTTERESQSVKFKSEEEPIYLPLSPCCKSLLSCRVMILCCSNFNSWMYSGSDRRAWL